jgi:type I restriction enzyme S subunit
METAVISLDQIREKGAWHYPLFSAEVRNAEAALRRSPYPRVPFKELVLKTARGFPGIGGSYSEDAVIPLLSVSSITTEGIDIEMSSRFISRDEHEKLSRSAVERSDVLVALAVGSKEKVAAVYESDEPANLAPHLALLRLRKSRVDPHYLAAFLNSSVGQSLIAHRTTGSIQRSLTISRLLDLSIPLPPLTEQKGVVEAVRKKQLEAEHREREAARLRHEADELMVALLQGEG